MNISSCRDIHNGIGIAEVYRMTGLLVDKNSALCRKQILKQPIDFTTFFLSITGGSVEI